MAGKLEALVQAKKSLDLELHALRQVKFSQLLADDSLRARVRALRDQMAAFDRELAALDGEDRWQFVFGCMLRGALADT